MIFEEWRLNKINHMLNSFQYPSRQEHMELTEAENGTLNVVKNMYCSTTTDTIPEELPEYVSNGPLSILKLPHTARRLYINHYFAMFGISCRSFSLCLMSCILRSSHSAYNNIQRLWHLWPIFCKSKFEHVWHYIHDFSYFKDDRGHYVHNVTSFIAFYRRYIYPLINYGDSTCISRDLKWHGISQCHHFSKLMKSLRMHNSIFRCNARGTF
jgi:hypothetical protein